MFADLDLDRVRAARATIRGIAVETPLVAADALGGDGDAAVWLKLETLQPTGAFKIRGAANALARLAPGARTRGVACASTGNHGRALAWAARRLGAPATVCLSRLVPESKVRAVEALGARVLRVGNSQDEAAAEVARLVAEEGVSEVPPFDHPDVIAGQATVALEILEQCPDVGTLLVPLSGGGLIGGVALAAKSLRPGVRVVGVSMRRGAAMHASLLAGRPVEVAEAPSLADSLGGGIGLDNRYTFRLCRELVDEVVLLDEREIYAGMAHLLHAHGLIAEGGAAVGVGAILAGRVDLDAPTVVVVSGRNVEAGQIARVARGEPVAVGAEREAP